MLSELAFNRTIVRYGEKINRGGKHLDALNESAQRFVERHSDPGILCVTEPNPHTTKCLLRVKQVPASEPGDRIEWGVIVGDAVHCWRSALDQLATALWTDKPNAHTGFPICLTKRRWVEDAPRMIWSIPEEYLAIFERAQPYHRGDKTHALRHPLAILHSLWNLDKHRTIPATGLIVRDVGIRGIDSPGLRLGEFKPKIGMAIKPDAVIAEAKIEGVSLQIAPQTYVNVDAHLSLGVAFGDGGELPEAIRAKPVVKTFHNVIAPAIASVIRDFHDVHHGKPLAEPWLAPKPSEME